MKPIIHKCLDCGRDGVVIRYNGVSQCRWCGSRSIWPVSSWRTKPVPVRPGRFGFAAWEIKGIGGLTHGKNF